MARNVRALAYRPKDAATVLGVSRSTIYEMIAGGKLEARKLGGATLIRHEEFVRVLEGTPLAEATKRAQGSHSTAAPTHSVCSTE